MATALYFEATAAVGAVVQAISISTRVKGSFREVSGEKELESDAGARKGKAETTTRHGTSETRCSFSGKGLLTFGWR